MEKTKDEVSKKEVVLNDKQLEAVEKYLESRLFVYGVKWHLFKYEETPRYSFQAYFSQELPKYGLGIFRHALEKCILGAKVWIDSQNKKCLPLISVCLDYEHIGGGSNGCEVNINFRVNEEGEIMEQYR